MKTLTVRYERDGDGWWVAQVKEMPGAITQGRSLRQARNRIREALWALTDDKKMAYSVKLLDEVQLPEKVRGAVTEARKKRASAEAIQEELARLTEKVLRVLTTQMHLSDRDAGELLGISHQRAHQLRHG